MSALWAVTFSPVYWADKEIGNLIVCFVSFILICREGSFCGEVSSCLFIILGSSSPLKILLLNYFCFLMF